jgi:phosphohistidine phosphatase
MDIYFIRHADAVPQGENGIDCDEKRTLSEEGWKQAGNLGRAFKKRGIVLDTIITSPLARAQQTAVQLRTTLELAESQVETCDELAPGGRPKRLAREINGLQGNSIAVIGHQPDLGLYAGWLLGEKEVQINFAKGGAALIHAEGSYTKGAGTLIWLITPDWLE